MTLHTDYTTDKVDWNEASQVFAAAFGRPKDKDKMAIAFNNSLFKCFLYDGDRLIGFGRALADGVFAAYIADIALLPEYQGQGLGKRIVSELLEMVKDHKKIILYANPGKEGFYESLGFRKMATAMAIFQNEREMIQSGVLVSENESTVDS